MVMFTSDAGMFFLCYSAIKLWDYSGSTVWIIFCTLTFSSSCGVGVSFSFRLFMSIPMLPTTRTMSPILRDIMVSPGCESSGMRRLLRAAVLEYLPV